MAAPIQIKDLILDSASRITMRWKEPYVTEGINKKMAVTLPHGIYRGWRLGTSGTNLTITLLPDPENNDHVLTTRTTLGDTLTLRRTGGNLSLPLTAPAFASQTVVIGVYITYSVTAETQAEIRGYLLADWNVLDAASQDAVTVLGTVNVPGSGLISAADISHERRSESWAKNAPAAVPWAALVKNGSFEWGPPAALGQNRWPPWENTLVPNGNWTVSVADPEPSSGLQHLQLTSTLAAAALTGAVWQKLDVPIQRGQYVRLRFRVKAVQAATGGTLTVTVRFRDTVGAATDSVQPVTLTAPDASYRTFDKIITIPAGVSQVGEVRIDANSLVFAVATAAVRIDNFQLFLETQDVLSAHPEDSGKGTVVASSVVLTDPASGATSNSVRVRVDPTGGATGAGQVIVERPDGDTLAAQPTLLVRGPVTSGGTITFTGGGVITGTGHIDLTGDGASSITALHGVGGAPDGIGVWGDGTGTGQGVYGKGSGGLAAVPPKARQGVLGVGGVGGHGLHGVGEGVGAGVFARSGDAVNSAGGDFTSIAGSGGPGIRALGSGTGSGVKGTGGGSTDSYGGEFTSSAPQGRGVLATGVGAAGVGLLATADGVAVSAQTTSPGGFGVFASYNNTSNTVGGGAIAASSNNGFLGANTILALQTAGTGSPGFAIRGNGILGGVHGQGIFAPGVYGQAMSTLSLAGVQGDGLGVAPGVLGVGSTGSRGIEGRSAVLSGVFGHGTAGSAAGVHGQADGTGSGVSGLARGAFQYGGYFVGDGTVPPASVGNGVRGEAKNGGTGVYGLADQLSTGIGVRGVGGLGGGVGVHGDGTDDLAGRFIGWSGGIWATSNSGALPGVYGDSTAGGGDGVQGYAHGSGRGVYGESPSGDGVRGYSVSGGTGVHGIGLNGVIGEGSTGASGVFGNNANAGFGVAGRSSHASGLGVLADHTGGGAALVANSTGTSTVAQFQSASGAALKFIGRNPAFTDGQHNTQTPLNVCKAWANISFSQAGVPYLVRGFNVSGVGANTTGHYFINFATRIGESERNVPSTTISYAGANPTWTITVGAGGFLPNDVGNSVLIGGMSNAGNNGSFRIVSYLSSTSVTIFNTGGTIEGPTASASWIIFQGEGAAHVMSTDEAATGGNRAECWITSLRPGQCNFIFRRHDTGVAIDLINQAHVYVTVYGIQY